MTLSHMRREIEDIPQAVARLLADRQAFPTAGAALRAKDPSLVATIARGSSDQAASFLKYAIELTARLPVASLGPSVVSIYGTELRLPTAAVIAISQSGQSPDIVAATASARRGGALTLALTNAGDYPLGRAAELSIDLHAGPEASVAATKTFVSSIAAGLALLAHWQEDEALLATLESLPDSLAAALSLDWKPLRDALDGHRSLYVIGRGPTQAIAGEAALKFKETCAIHAEAYSSAEVLHGPARIVEAGFPVLALAVGDAAESSIAGTADRLAAQGATVFATTALSVRALQLPCGHGTHPLVDALGLVVSFYAFVEDLSRHRGFDPDRPPHLRKVTETL